MPQSDREDSGVLDPVKRTMTNDGRRNPYWNRKFQREFEAKNLGPPKKSTRAKEVVITMSDDEPDEQLEKMGDDWTNAIWDELVKDKPERWDIHDALRLGKRQAEDPSSMKLGRPVSTSNLDENRQSEHHSTGKGATPRKYVDARMWEGKNLNRPVDEGRLTLEQASSIMRLRRAIAKPVPHGSEDEENGPAHVANTESRPRWHQR